jgi:hypothetical protein
MFVAGSVCGVGVARLAVCAAEVLAIAVGFLPVGGWAGFLFFAEEVFRWWHCIHLRISLFEVNKTNFVSLAVPGYKVCSSLSLNDSRVPSSKIKTHPGYP